MDLTWCEKLVSLPERFGELTNLQYLRMCDCPARDISAALKSQRSTTAAAGQKAPPSCRRAPGYKAPHEDYGDVAPGEARDYGGYEDSFYARPEDFGGQQKATSDRRRETGHQLIHQREGHRFRALPLASAAKRHGALACGSSPPATRRLGALFNPELPGPPSHRRHRCGIDRTAN